MRFFADIRFLCSIVPNTENSDDSSQEAPPAPQGDEPTCYMCFDDEDTAENPMITPCKCLVRMCFLSSVHSHRHYLTQACHIGRVTRATYTSTVSANGIQPKLTTKSASFPASTPHAPSANPHSAATSNSRMDALSSSSRAPSSHPTSAYSWPPSTKWRRGCSIPDSN